MSGTLEEFFVSIGVKGQAAVLKNIDKVKKEAKSLSKIKSNIDLGKGNISKAMSGMKSMASVMGITGQSAEPSAAEKKQDKIQKDNTNKFSNGINKFNNGAKNILASSKNFDPVALAQTAITGTGKAFGAAAAAIPAVGAYLKDIPPALAEATNSMVSMGVGALEMAKQAASGQWGLQSRDTTVSHFGGGDVNKEAVNAGISNNEYANLMMKVASSNGKLNGSLKEMITELAKTKDTEQLGNVASGNFASTGTTKGWMMQQIMDSMGNVPPEIRQKMTAALLPQMSGDIMGRGGQDAQNVNAGYERQAENKTTDLYGKSTGDDTVTSLKALNKAINEMTGEMFNSGVGMATTISVAAKQIGDLAKAVKKAKEDIENFSVLGVRAPGWVKDLFK